MNVYEPIPVTWKRAVAVWWSIFWRTAAVTFVVGLILELPISILVDSLGVESIVGRVVAKVLDLLVALLVGIYAVKDTLGKKHGDFELIVGRLRAVPDEESTPDSSATTS